MKILKKIKEEFIKIGEKIKEFINNKRKYKVHKVRVIDSNGKEKIVKATIEADAPLCTNTKDIINDFFSKLPNLRD